MADSENTDSTADGGVRKVRTALLSLSLSKGGAEVSSGLLGRNGCARSLCGGADLVLSDMGESLMHNAPECCDGPQVWNAVPKEGNWDHQEGKKVEDGSLYFCLGRCEQQLYWKR